MKMKGKEKEKMAIPLEKKQVFLDHLRRAIKEQGWSPSSLAKEMGAEPSWLTRILNGERGMNIYDFLRISEVLGISPQELIAGFPSERREKSEAQQVAERLSEAIPDEVWEILLKLREKK